jgi:hypothetical protein
VKEIDLKEIDLDAPEPRPQFTGMSAREIKEQAREAEERERGFKLHWMEMCLKGFRQAYDDEVWGYKLQQECLNVIRFVEGRLVEERKRKKP